MAQDIEELRRIIVEALSADADAIEICRRLMPYRSIIQASAPLEWDIIAGVESESDGLPSDAQAGLWQNEAYVVARAKRTEYNKRVEAIVRAALQRLNAALPQP